MFKRPPGAGAIVTILFGALVFGFVMEANKKRLEDNRAAEEKWTKIEDVPSKPGLYKFYDEADNRSCRVLVAVNGSISMDCVSLDTREQRAIERIPWPKKQDKWGA